MTSYNYPPNYNNSLKVWWDCSDPSGNGIVPINGATVSKIVNKTTPGTYDMDVGGFPGAIAGTYKAENKSLIMNDSIGYMSAYPANPSTETMFVIFSGRIVSGVSATIVGSQAVDALSGGREVSIFTTGSGLVASVVAGITNVNIPIVLSSTGVANTGTPLTNMTCVTLNPPNPNSISVGLSINGNNPQTALLMSSGYTFATNTFTGFGHEITITGDKSSEFTGDIMEVVIYNDILNTSQRQTVEGYLAWKWNITGNLPVVHPYKSVAAMIPSTPTPGYKISTGADLNTVFDFYDGGPPATTTGYKDASGNDLNPKFAPYVSGRPATTTGYKMSSGDDLSTVFAPIIPAFPTLQSTIPNFGNYVYVNLDGSNMVLCSQGGSPAGDPYTYLYWSDNYGKTLNIATINGSITNFFGCVAISGQNAIAMGRLTQTGTNNFYLSSDYGKSYTVTSTPDQPASGRIGGYVDICINGTNAVWSGDGNLAYYSTNSGATWTLSTGSYYCVQMRMFGTNVFLSCLNAGFYYSTNSGQTYTKNTNVPAGAVGCSVQIGTNIYLGIAPGQCLKFAGGPESTPTVTATLAGGDWVVNIAGCPRSIGGDFVMIDDQGAGMQYSNDSGVTFQTTGGVGMSLTLVVTATRIIMGSGNNGFYWGKNTYIAPARDAVAFPTARSGIPGIGTYNYVSMDGYNCVFATQGSKPVGDAYSYLYWSNDFGATLNIATISTDGVTYTAVQFFGCVAISGQYAVAMGRLTQAGTNNYYFSSDYGRSYTISSTTSQPTAGSSSQYVYIGISGNKAVWTAYQVPAYYSTINFTNNTATWTSSGLNRANASLYMNGSNVYCAHLQNNGWSYSTDFGQTYTQNANVGGSTNSSTQVGSNIYITGYPGRFLKLTGDPGSVPIINVTNLLGIGAFIIAVTGCPRINDDDFVMFYTDTTTGPYYSNNGGVTFQLASAPNNSLVPLTLVANSTRIILGSQNGGTPNGGFFCGKNAYITTVASPPPAFPTAQSSVPGSGGYISMDGSNCVCTVGSPSATSYAYLYWSNDFCATLNKAKISTDGGVTYNIIQFFGSVAISGKNAIAMGRAGSPTATLTYYLSSDYGHSYTVTPISGQSADNGGSISMDGPNAIWGSYGLAPRYSSDYGATWNLSSGADRTGQCLISGNNAYCACYMGRGFYYSTNKGQNFTKNLNIPSGSAVTKCGSNLYIVGLDYVYKSTDNGATVSIIMSQYIRTPTSITSYPGTNGDFVWFGNEDTGTNYYTNNGDSTGTVIWTTVTGANKPGSSVANRTRMISGAQGSGSLYWGNNTYITSPPYYPNAPAFPTALSPGIGGTYNNVNMDEYNCVFSTQGINANPNAYLYWSNDFGATLNQSTINGSVVNFYGCVAISGQYAVALGKAVDLTSTANFYFSSNYGRSYVVSTTADQFVNSAPGIKIAISGTKAIWSSSETPAYYSNIDFTNNAATWTQVVANGVNVDVSMFGSNAYVCCNTNNSSANGFQYSTNFGATFTKNTNILYNVRNCRKVGSNIYVGVYNAGTAIIYKLTGGPGSNPTSVFTSPGGANGLIVSLACCQRASNDFVIFYTDGNGPYYSNNGGTNFVLASPSQGNIYPQIMYANLTRILMGGQNGGIYWGKNSYITL